MSSYRPPLADPFGANSPLFSGTTAPQMAPIIPGLGGAGGAAAQMLLPSLLQMMAPGFQPTPFGGQQNMADFLRAQRYQQDLLWHQELVREADQEQIFRLMRGTATLMGANVDPATAQGAATLEHLQRLAGQSSVISVFGSPMLPSHIADAVGGGVLTEPFRQRIMAAGRNLQDPVTGQFGLTAETASRLSVAVNQQLFGAGADLSAMQGFGMAAAGDMFAVGRRGGFGPELLANPEDSEAVRNLNAGRVATYSKNMAGLWRAMEDLFGPGMAVEQAVNIAHALTQGGLSRMTLNQLESTVRRIDAAASLSGMSVQEMAGLQVAAASASQRMGGSRAFGVEAGLGSAAFMMSFGGNDAALRMANVSLRELAQQDAMLRGQAAASPLSNRFFATARLGEAGMLREGSTAAALHAAVMSGETEFTDAAGNRRSVNLDAGEWRRIMAQGSGMSAAEVAAIELQRTRNERVGIRNPGVMHTLRGLQFTEEIRPRIIQALRARIPGLSDTEAQAMANDLVAFRPEAGASQAEADAQFRSMLSGRTGLDAGGAEVLAGELDTMASRFFGQRNFANLSLLNDPSRRDAVMGAETRINIRGDIAGALSFAGRTSPLQGLIRAIQGAGPDTSLTDVLAGAAGFIPADELEGPLSDLRGQVLEQLDRVRGAGPTGEGGRFASPAQERVFRDELRKLEDLSRRLGRERVSAGLDTDAGIDEATRAAREEIERVSDGAAAAGDVADDRSDLVGRRGKMTISGTLRLLGGDKVEIAATSGGEGHGVAVV